MAKFRINIEKKASDYKERVSAIFRSSASPYLGQMDGLELKAITRRIADVAFFDNIRFEVDGKFIYEFPFEPLVDLSKSKRMVDTDIVYQGKVTGTVSEIIADGYWQITMRGLLIHGDPDELMEMVKELAELADRNESLEVSSLLFSAVGIENVIIRDIAFPELEGYPDTKPFVLQARSDTPIELVINETQ